MDKTTIVCFLLLTLAVIFLFVYPCVGDKRSKGSKDESFNFYYPINNRYTPKYQFSYPYNYFQNDYDPYPPNLFTRMNQNEPGFAVNGTYFSWRPGFSPSSYNRGRWNRYNGTNYVINNYGVGNDVEQYI